MNTSNTRPGLNTLQNLVLVLSICAAPMMLGLGGCSTGTRYKQSTGEYIDDSELSSRVRKALDNDARFQFHDVSVVAFKGVVQVNGFVNSAAEKRQAGIVARRTAGVHDVQNKVTIKE